MSLRERVAPGGSPPWAKDEEWPKCHFRPMTLHTSCSDTSGNSDGYECDHCGHTVPLVQWIETLKQKRKKQMTDQEKIDALTQALKFYAGSFYPTRCRFTPGLEWNPKEELLDDCGNIAAAALEKVGGV